MANYMFLKRKFYREEGITRKFVLDNFIAKFFTKKIFIEINFMGNVFKGKYQCIPKMKICC